MSGSSVKEKKLEGLIRRCMLNAAWVCHVPLCADLFGYRHTLRPILDQLIGDSKHVIPLTVDRENVFRQAISFYKTSKAGKHTQLLITFRSGGVEEQGYDGAGLRREFFSAFFKACLEEADMFVGKGRRKLPTNNMTMVQGGFFEALGRAIVSSILDGDCGFPYFSPVVFYYLVGADLTEHLCLDDVPDPDIKALSEELLAAKTDDDVLAAIDTEQGPVIDHVGWPPGQAFTMKTRHALVEQLVRWSIIEKRKTSLDKLKEGLRHMGFLEAMNQHPQLALPLLVYSEEYSITAKYMCKVLTPKVQNLETAGEIEDRAKQYMLDWLKSLSDACAQSLYQFVTGSADPSVHEESIDVEFNNLDKKLKLPSASTCSRLLRIPLGNSSSVEFKGSMETALDNGLVGFGDY